MSITQLPNSEKLKKSFQKFGYFGTIRNTLPTNYFTISISLGVKHDLVVNDIRDRTIATVPPS